MSNTPELSEINKKISETNCKLIAVSKTKSVEDIRSVYEQGIRSFGENKAQEMASKHAALPKDIEWHFIGHLQRNKVKYIAPFVHLLHSVDSLKLLQEINKQGQKLDKTINCLIQVYIAEEENKFGFDPDEVADLFENNEILKLKNIKIHGLMAMATFTNDQEQIKCEFQRAKLLFDTMKNKELPANVVMSELSMGMSGDYKLAVDEGSTMVRIGSAIFGSRNP